jgi:hypothetical protein
MNYCNHYTQQIFDELNQTGGIKDTYCDFFDGSDYLQAIQEGKIKQEDQVLMFSTDGTQLFQNKASDCWMSIWVLFDRSLDMHYKKSVSCLASSFPVLKNQRTLTHSCTPHFITSPLSNKKALPSGMLLTTPLSFLIHSLLSELPMALDWSISMDLLVIMEKTAVGCTVE